VTLAPGTRLGPYEILSTLGAGGMGEVYRARDAKLNRDVALKILPDALSLDSDRVARFRREAHVLASLNHPNIAAIYGFEDSGSTHALVLELVEGPTLADRIAKGPIPLDEALPIAKQIAEALEAAHEQGIIHRDLKPANIKLRDDDAVKVLDFGLAKAMEPASAISPALTASPTITTPAQMTGVGMILGTAAYMSPEQAKGRPADKRSDIWAFGCVLYEMLTGKRAFDADDVSETLAAVLRGDPEWKALPTDLSPAVRDAIEKCLQKDRAARIHDVAIVRFLLDYRPPATAREQSPVWSHALDWLGGAAVIAVLGAGAAWSLWPRSLSSHVGRFTAPFTGTAPLSIGSPFRDLVISPDGQWIVYSVAGGLGNRTVAQLMLRRLDQLEATPLGVPTATQSPFFSADGRWVGFYSAGEIWKAPVVGGPPISICHIEGLLRGGAAWGSDGTIVFSSGNGGAGLQRVSASGGQPVTVTTPDAKQGELRQILPSFLPDGRTVLFTVETTGATSGANAASGVIAAVELKTGHLKNLIRGGSQPEYVDPGYLVYNTPRGLMAARFDAARVEIVGDPVPVVGSVVTKPTLTGEFSVSRNGTLIYVPAANVRGAVGVGNQSDRSLVWVDRQGHEDPIDAPARPYVYARLSPDGTRVALDVRDQDADIWIWNLERGGLSRLTNTRVLETSPLWTPDSRRIVYGSQRDGSANLYWQSADGSGSAERLTTSSNNQVPTGVSADGRDVLYYEAMPQTDLDVMVMHLDGQRRSDTVLGTTFRETNAVFSPNNRWIAYESNESGSFDVYVRPFPDVNRQRVQISTSGGHQPLWAHSGRELFYLNERNELMVTAVEAIDSLKAGVPVKVLGAKYFGGGGGAGARTYDVSRDDRRFLMIKGPPDDIGAQAPKDMVVIVNWVEELKERLGAK
jgi:serine/threonine-protein kinase